MEFLNNIINLFSEADSTLLLFINGMHTSILDTIMWLASDKLTWIPFYLVLLYAISVRLKWKQRLLCFVCIAVIIALTDQTCASVIRPAMERLRPSNPDNPISSMLHFVNNYRGGRYGFPSCHAANSMALAVFMILFFRKRAVSVIMISWASLVCISRIYLGVHYPSDIIGGTIVGGTYALIIHYIYSYITAAMTKRKCIDKIKLCNNG